MAYSDSQTGGVFINPIHCSFSFVLWQHQDCFAKSPKILTLMALSVCSPTSSPFTSPRISLSDDVTHGSIADFYFCIAGTSADQISTADELFADGKILPLRIKKTGARQPDPIHSHKKSSVPPPEIAVVGRKKRLIEFLSANFDSDLEDEPISKPFWRYRRSSSSNYETGRNSSSGLPRSLQLLTRSNSTGSAPKTFSAPQKHKSHKGSLNFRTNSSGSAANQYHPYSNSASRRNYLKKSSSKSYGDGARITPVLNIPPAYTARGTVSLFGISSFFCGNKSKNKKKKKKKKK